MDLAAMIEGMAGEARGNDSIITDPKQIMKALKRPKLEGLKFGDKLEQVKHGENYNYKRPEKGKQAIFVRYLTDAEKVSLNFEEVHNRSFDADCIICCGINKSDGEVLTWPANSSFFKLA